MNYILCNSTTVGDHYEARLDWGKLRFYAAARHRGDQISELVKVKDELERNRGVIAPTNVPPPVVLAKVMVTEWQPVAISYSQEADV